MRNIVALARKECANHSHFGPRELKDYCCMEPHYNNMQCIMLIGLPCRYFRDAVLPLKPDLITEWNLFCQKTEPAFQNLPIEEYGLRSCEKCGKAFDARSNRQQFCPECSPIMKRRQSRERKQKQREKVG
jgi:hypothetical protein